MTYLYHLPITLVCIVGIVLAVMNLRRARIPSVLALVGLITMLTLDWSRSFVIQAMFSNDFENMVQYVNLGITFAYAVCQMMLVAAIFAGRGSTTETTIAPADPVQVQFAQGLLEEGKSYDEVEEQLVQRGLDSEGTQSVMHALEEAAYAELRKAGMRSMILGSLICILGIAVTVISYMLAANNPNKGATYVVTYGLIIAGAGQAIRGLVQMSK